jgi:hypothetical protein
MSPIVDIKNADPDVLTVDQIIVFIESSNPLGHVFQKKDFT